MYVCVCVCLCVCLPVLRVVGPHSGAHRGPDDHQQFPQPYWGKHGPVAPLNDPVQPQGQQHGEQQQAGVDQELTAAAKRATGDMCGVKAQQGHVKKSNKKIKK